MGYIHLKYTGPQNLISLTTWTSKCTMMSKNNGGKNISSWHKMITISAWSSSNFKGSMTLLQIEEKNAHKRVIVCLTFFGKIPRIATGNNCCIQMWQSWDFRLTSFKSCMDTKLWIFKEYPCLKLGSNCKNATTPLYASVPGQPRHIRWGKMGILH